MVSPLLECPSLFSPLLWKISLTHQGSEHMFVCGQDPPHALHPSTAPSSLAHCPQGSFGLPALQELLLLWLPDGLSAWLRPGPLGSTSAFMGPEQGPAHSWCQLVSESTTVASRGSVCLGF